MVKNERRAREREHSSSSAGQAGEAAAGLMADGRRVASATPKDLSLQNNT